MRLVKEVGEQPDYRYQQGQHLKDKKIRRLSPCV